MGTPGTYSITKYGWPSGVVPASKTLAIEGWSMMASDCRSDAKRFSTASSYMPALINFTATRRRTGAVCSASHTLPMPPSPSFCSSRYGPKDFCSTEARSAAEPAEGYVASNPDVSRSASARGSDNTASAWRARYSAATSIAGTSRKLSSFSCCARSNCTARRSASSSPQACSRKASLALFSSFSAESYKRSIFCQRSGSVQPLPAQLATQPILGHLPVAQHGVAGNLQDLSRFLDIETAEKAQFHHLALPRIHLSQSLERLIQVGEIQPLSFRPVQSLVQPKHRDLSASFQGAARPPPIRQDPPHRLGAHG